MTVVAALRREGRRSFRRSARTPMEEGLSPCDQAHIVSEARVTIGHLAYQSNAALTASPGQLVVMLFDGCLKFLRRAEAAARTADGPSAKVTEATSRSLAIIMELNATLDMEQGGEIATNLRSIYLFLQRHLNDAAREGSPEKIAQATRLMGELRGAFAEAAKQAA